MITPKINETATMKLAGKVAKRISMQLLYHSLLERFLIVPYGQINSPGFRLPMVSFETPVLSVHQK
jgi:hypothetical protein